MEQRHGHQPFYLLQLPEPDQRAVVLGKETPIAALACIAQMAAAILFHVSRGEAADTPFNFVLIALLAFVYWGRKAKVPIAKRA